MSKPSFAWHWYLIAELSTEIWNKTVFPTIKRPFALRVEIFFKAYVAYLVLLFLLISEPSS